MNERTIVTSVFQKFEEILLLIEQSIDTDKPIPAVKTENTGILREAHPYKNLWFYNGIRVSSLPQLYARMQEIDDETFIEHVNEYKHDISEWVKESLHDEILGERLSEGKTKQEIQTIIEHAMNEKIHSTLKESDGVQKSSQSNKTPAKKDELNILDALELPELPSDIVKILGLKNYKDVLAEKLHDEDEPAKKKEKEQLLDHGLIPVTKKPENIPF